MPSPLLSSQASDCGRQRLPADLWAEGRKKLTFDSKHKRGMRMLARKREKEVSAASTKELVVPNRTLVSQGSDCDASRLLRTSTGSDVTRMTRLTILQVTEGGGETKWLKMVKVCPQR